ncbi:MAG: filamentous hemagglutinin N-terminal domain-containing protein, partial [Phycisphaerae bacterium]|nr:filamentous hemagglutinin N-terminal domain-containing protein [Phycisphaerae bacterium]
MTTTQHDALAISRLLRHAGACSACIFLLSAPLLAGPENPQVVKGKVQINRSGDVTVIEASRNSIINYSSFNVRSGETVRFVQPDAAARVLNRVTAPDPSRIDGTLTANGRVYIVNPAGVYFGRGALVDVGRIYAAAGSMSDADFLRGIDRFTNVTGGVVNEGVIRADMAAFVGATVSNSGTIDARGGVVAMVSGEDVLVGEMGGRVFAKFDRAAGNSASGGDHALPKRSPLGAGDAFALAVSNTGTIHASQVRMESNAKGSLVRAGGTIDASNPTGQGGRIELLGDNVAVAGATIDASGAAGGGTVLIGGDWQGGPGAPAASNTIVTRDSVIRADATNAGDGGTVVVWSDDTTRFRGSISASGGPVGGDGGRVEVSGKRHLSFAGTVDASAPRGQRGSLLLDPLDILVTDQGTGAGADDGEAADGMVGAADGSGASFTISETALEALGDVDITLQATRHITIDFLATDNTLSLGSASGKTVAFVADADSDGVGDFSMDSFDTIATSGGNLRFEGHSVTLGALQTNGGNVTLVANRGSTGTGNVLLQGTIDLGAGSGVFQSSGVNFTNQGPITTNGGAITVNHTGLVTISNPLDSTLAAGGAISLTGSSIRLDYGTTAILNATNADVTLNSPTFLDSNATIAGKGVRFVSSVDSGAAARSLTIDTNNSGQTRFDAAVGGAAPLSALTTNADGTSLLAGSVSTTGDQTYNDPVTLSANADFTTGAGGTVTFSNTSSLSAGADRQVVITADEVNLPNTAGSVTGTGTGTLTIQPTSNAVNINVGSAAGAGAELDLSATDLAAIAMPNLVIGRSAGAGTTTIGNASFTQPVIDAITFRQGGAAGAIAVTGVLTSSATDGSLTFVAGTGDAGLFSQGAAGAINSGTAPLAITADAINLSGASNTLVTTGALTLQPSSGARTVVLGAAGAASDFALDTGELAAFSDTGSTLASVTIGRSDSSVAMSISAATFNDPVTLRMSGAGGTIAVNGALSGAGNGAFAFVTNNGVSFGASVTTVSGNVSITGPAFIAQGASVTLDAGSGDLTVGSIDGTTGGAPEHLTLTSTGTITIGGALGAGVPLGTVTQTAGAAGVNVNADVSTTGTQTYGNAIVLGGAGATRTLSGSGISLSGVTGSGK